MAYKKKATKKKSVKKKKSANKKSGTIQTSSAPGGLETPPDPPTNP